MLKKFEEAHKNETGTINNSTQNENETDKNTHTCVLKIPFRGNKGEALIKNFKNTLKRTLPDDTSYRIVHTGTKLSKHFTLKDKTNKAHLSNFIYKHKCRNKKCKECYVGETGRRKVKRTTEHGGTDKKSHIYKHSRSKKHPRAKDEDFEILAVNYPNRRKRKLAEAMFIRDLKPSLNKQKDSFKLTLFV